MALRSGSIHLLAQLLVLPESANDAESREFGACVACITEPAQLEQITVIVSTEHNSTTMQECDVHHGMWRWPPPFAFRVTVTEGLIALVITAAVSSEQARASTVTRCVTVERPLSTYVCHAHSATFHKRHWKRKDNTWKSAFAQANSDSTQVSQKHDRSVEVLWYYWAPRYPKT
jgi:hypothetical protein